jgi:hypothetical protein
MTTNYILRLVLHNLHIMECQLFIILNFKILKYDNRTKYVM